MERTLVHYLPLVTTGVAAGFAVVLFRHWRSKPQAKYLMWWTAGIVAFGLGTLAESLTIPSVGVGRFSRGRDVCGEDQK